MSLIGTLQQSTENLKIVIDIAIDFACYFDIKVIEVIF